jgi:predicted aspartyl protease
MGVFSVDIEVAKPGGRPLFHPVRGVMVDSGSEVTWIAGDLLRSAGVTVRKKDQPFVMANGQHITRDVGYAILRCGSFETIDEVVFAHPGDLQLLGARTLEGFNTRVDARAKRLVAAGPLPAAKVRRTPSF